MKNDTKTMQNPMKSSGEKGKEKKNPTRVQNSTCSRKGHAWNNWIRVTAKQHSGPEAFLGFAFRPNLLRYMEESLLQVRCIMFMSGLTWGQGRVAPPQLICRTPLIRVGRGRTKKKVNSREKGHEKAILAEWI